MPAHNYGQISQQQQLHFLCNLIKKIEDERNWGADEQLALLEMLQQLEGYKLEQFNEEKLEQAIAGLKERIEELEAKKTHVNLIQTLKNYGLYRILYRNSLNKGIDDESRLGTMLKAGFIGVGLSALAVLLFTTAALLGAPVWLGFITNVLFATAATYIAALIYGVVNDLFATKANLPYFLLGHQPQQNSVLRSNDPVVQGVAWGVAATFGPALLASLAFGLGTLLTATLVPVASFVFPVMFVAMPLIAWGADSYAKKKAKEYESQGLEYRVLGANNYQIEGLSHMSNSPAEKAAWLANSDRNLFGFTKVPLIGLGALASMVGLSALHSYLPVILFSTAISTIMPAAVVLAGIAFLAGAGIYTYINRNKQIDNRFKLIFSPNAKLKHELYLDEDLALVAELTKDFQVKPSAAPMPEAPGHFTSPLRSLSLAIQEVENRLSEGGELRLACV